MKRKFKTAFILACTFWLASVPEPSICAANAADKAPNPITDVRVLASDGILNVFSLSKGKLQLWQVPEKSPTDIWTLKRTWNDFVTFWYGLGDGKEVIIATKNIAEIYRVGAWDNPLLSKADGLSPNIKSVWNIYPSHPQDKSAGIAVELKDQSGQAAGTGWKLFFAADGQKWQPLELESGSPVISDFLRCGPGEIAIREGGAPARAGKTKGWRLYKLNAQQQWRSAELPAAESVITGLKTFDYPNGLAALEDGRTVWLWFYRRNGGQWADIHGVIPGSPETIDEIKGYGQHQILAILGPGRSKGASDALVWEYYYHEAGTWLPLSSVLGNAGGAIFQLLAFAGARGIAFQGLDPITGQHATDWTMDYLTEDGRWVSARSVMKHLPQHIWNVEPFGNFGIGVESGFIPGDDSRNLDWKWYVRKSDAWVLLHKLIPQAPNRIWDLYSDDLGGGIAIENDVAAGSPAMCSWFLPNASGGWKEVAQAMKLPPGFPDRENLWSVSLPASTDKNYRRGVLAVWNRTGDSLWFLRDKSGWISVADQERSALPQAATLHHQQREPTDTIRDRTSVDQASVHFR